MADALGAEAWKEHMSAFDRVQSVSTSLSQPRTAADIAEDAHVDQEAVQEHLDQLVDLGVLLEKDDEGTPQYAPDPLHTRMQALRDLLDAHDRKGLDELRSELQDELEMLEGRERDLVEHRLGLVEEAIRLIK